MANEQGSYLSLGEAGKMSDAEFMTGEEKELVLKHWERFLRSGLEPKYFTKKLYHHLINHCGFIAYYDINGFYHTYFDEGDDTVGFLKQFDSSRGCPPAESYLTFWVNYPGMNDINNAMIDVAAKYIPALVQSAEKKQKERDIDLARMLLAKHKINIDV
jgi:hypothetical protein